MQLPSALVQGVILTEVRPRSGRTQSKDPYTRKDRSGDSGPSTTRPPLRKQGGAKSQADAPLRITPEKV
jgi:hypothetical protein